MGSGGHILSINKNVDILGEDYWIRISGWL